MSCPSGIPRFLNERHIEREQGRPVVTPSFTEADYYSRQMNLPELGADGQEKLRSSSVLVIGAGGLGSPALNYLAAAGVGALGICDGDRLEASNLHRQTLYNYAEVGQGKAQLAAKRLREQNPFIALHVHDGGLTPENAMATFEPYDIVLDCTDNFATKFLINDAAVLTGKPAIFASIYRFEGQIAFVRPKSGPCLRCLWPNVPEAGCVASCAEAGVLGFVPGIFGVLQAMEAIKYIVGLPEPLGQDLIIYDCLNYAMQRVRIPRQTSCPVCGSNPRIHQIVREEYFPRGEISLDVAEMPDERLAQFRVIDIRERDEVEAQPLEGVEYDHIAMSEWDPNRLPVERGERCLLCCAHGIRSLMMAERLRDMGYPEVYSAKNGWDAFHRRAIQ